MTAVRPFQTVTAGRRLADLTCERLASSGSREADALSFEGMSSPVLDALDAGFRAVRSLS